jgi:hypothetical protein
VSAVVDRRLVLGVAVWAAVLGVVPAVGEAAPLAPRATHETPIDASALERRLVTARLVALGVSRAEVTARLATLSDDEQRQLATRLDEAAAGGSPAAALAVAIVVGLLVVLVLELLGRRVISRPTS